MSTSNPTIVVVPGAWHSPIHYKDLTTALIDAGYPTVSATLPSLNAPVPEHQTVSHDTEFIRNDLLGPLLSEEKDVVLVMHSYGGSPGGVAANGLSKTERSSRGEKGGILGLVFIAALLTPQGVSLKSAVGGNFHPWVGIDSPKAGYLFPLTPEDIFYNDISPSKAAEAVKELKPMSATALSTPTESAAAWVSPDFDGRRAYIRCADDRCIPDFVQDGMLAGTGVEWDVHRFDTGHSPFLSKPEKLSETIVGLAQKWAVVRN